MHQLRFHQPVRCQIIADRSQFERNIQTVVKRIRKLQQIRIHPRPPKTSAAAEGEQAPLSWVKASYHSPHGPISTHWRRDGRTYTLAVTLPANTSGTIWLPARTADAATEGGRPLAQSRGLEIVGPQDDGLLLRAPSGSYAFSVALPDDYQ